MLGIELIEGEYDTQNWLDAVRGLEKEPEKGARCAVCFDRRFEVSAQKAAQIGEKRFTSTLLTSPKKSLKQLKASGDALGDRYGVSFVAPDYRKASGTQEQNALAKKDQLYRQDYCGCLFGLSMQREQQERLADELISPLSGQIQPESIEARIALYEERIALEEKKKPYRIVKQRFLNWRLLFGLLRNKKETIPSHILPYSTLKRNYTRGKIEYETDSLYHLSRDEVKFITLSRYNALMGTAYETVTALIFSPPSFVREQRLRERLGLDMYDLSAVLVVETVPQGKIELLLDSRIYSDVQEVIRR